MTNNISPALKPFAMPVADLMENPKEQNPNRGDDQAVANSMHRFGQLKPIVYQHRSPKPRAKKRNVVEAGNTTLRAARDILGWDMVAAVDANHLTVEEAKAFGLADNRTRDLATYDEDVLGDSLRVLAETPDGDELLAAAGYDDVALVQFMAGGRSKNDPWDRDLKPMPDAGHVETGEVYQIGPHRLAVGDSSDPGLWSALPASDLLLTDPPYGIDYDGGGVERERIEDDDNPEVAAQLLSAVVELWLTNSTPGAMSFCFGPPGPDIGAIADVLQPQGLFRWMLIWVKDRATFGRADFHHQHEPIFYGWNPNAARRHPPDDRTHTTVLRFDRPSSSPIHPTQKPLELLDHLIRTCSTEGDIVCDPFSGSGSTIVAAHRTGRVGVGIEKSVNYANAALERIEKAVGEKRERLN